MNKPIYVIVLGVALVCCSPGASHAQESPWTFSVSGGWVYMNLNQVEEDNQSDVEGWHRQGIFIDELGSVKSALLLSAKGTYRIERDFAISLSFAHAQREVSASYTGFDAALDLKRSVGFTDVMAGLGYYYPLAPIRSEAFVGGEVGFSFARADAEAFGTRTEKVEDTTQTYILVDSDGSYRKSKLILNAVAGANIHVFDPFFIQVEAKYKFGQVGTMEGDVRRFDETSKQESTIEFNYSGLFLSIGIGIVF